MNEAQIYFSCIYFSLYILVYIFLEPDVALKPWRFLHNMDLAYAAADLVVSRAGAMTCTEILATGKPSILVVGILIISFLWDKHEITANNYDVLIWIMHEMIKLWNGQSFCSIYVWFLIYVSFIVVLSMTPYIDSCK